MPCAPALPCVCAYVITPVYPHNLPRSFGGKFVIQPDGTAKGVENYICYCLKRENNAYFNEHMMGGDLDLSQTVLIVDEVDDLVVNENPNSNYVKPDAERTPGLRQCFAALKADEYALVPRGVHDMKLWEAAQQAARPTHDS